MSKRILSFLLAVVMVVSMVPATAFPTFAAETTTVYEANIASAVTVDGAMTETAYLQALPINGGENAPSGKVYATWMNDALYLAVPFVNAEALGVTIGEKTFSLNLSTKALTDAPADVVAEVAGGVAELKIPLDAVGVQLTDYNQDANFYVSLTNANGTAAVAENPIKLRFTNVKVSADRVDFTTIASNRKSGVTVVNANEATFVNTNAVRQYLMKEQVAAIDLNKDFYYQTTLSITDMEATDNKTHDWYGGRAFYFWVSDEYGKVNGNSVDTADAVLFDLYDHSTNGLTLRVRQHRTDMTKYVDVDLGRTDNGVPFTLGMKYSGSAKTVDIYVDGVYVRTVPNAMCEDIAYTLGNAAVMNLACKGTVKVNDLFVTVPETCKLSDELTAAKVMNGINLTDLKENVALPATYTSANLGELALSWKSSNTDVISDAGVIQQSSRVGYAKLTASVGGKDMFSVDVSVAVKEGIEEEPIIAEGTYEAFVASNITLDGNLNEVAWHTGAELGKGQPFDILWDGANLYFGVVAAVGDETMTVTIGEETVVSNAAKTGTNFEVKVPYTTKDVTTLEDVTITVGKSAWTGSVDLVAMARRNQLTYADFKHEKTAGANTTATATADGKGITFEMPTLAAPNSAVSTYYARKTQLGVLDATTGDVVFEFTLDPTQMPVPTNGHFGTVGATNAVWSGLDVTVTNGVGNAIRFGIVNRGSEGLWMNVVKGSTVCQEGFSLGKQAGGDPFDVKIVWKRNNGSDTQESLVVYIDGEYKETRTYVNNPAVNTAEPDANITKISGVDANDYKSMVHFRATRYDYNTTNGFFDQPLKFTVSDVRLSEPVEVIYPEEDDTVTAKGTYDAFVASEITEDGNLNEVAWRTGAQLGKGQPFDILWDGGNLYFGVVAAEGDETMTVTIGEETVVSNAAKTGTNFEVKVPYTTKGVTTLEDVTITVGKSAWTGDVNLVKMARQFALTGSDLTKVVSNQVAGSDMTATSDGVRFYMPEIDNTTGKLGVVAGYKSALPILTSRTTDITCEFHLDATSLPTVTKEGMGAVGNAYSIWSGLEFALIDDAGKSIVMGFAKGEETGTFINIKVYYPDTGKYSIPDRIVLGDLTDFDVKVVWGKDGSLRILIDGDEKLNANDRTTLASSVPGSSERSCVFFRSMRYEANLIYSNLDALDVNISNFRLSKPVDVVYEGDAPNVDAYVAPNAPALDGDLEDVLWSVPNKLSKVTGTGVSGIAYMAWGKGNLYVAVTHKGATTLDVALGEKSWTLDLTAEDIASADGIVTGKNVDGVAELKINMLKAGIEILDFAQVEKFQLKLTGTSGTAALGEAYANLTFSEHETARFGITEKTTTGTAVDSRTAQLKGSGRQYLLLGTSNINHAYDIFYEQTMTIKALPGADGTVNIVHDAKGLSVAIMDTTAISTATVIYPKGEDLWIRVAKADGQSEDFALGKKLGETFHFGYLWKTDDSIVLFVDGEQVAEVANATYAVNWSGNYYATNTYGMTDHDLVIKDAAHTVFIDKNVPENTTAAVLTGINTNAVTENLPATFINGHFAYNVTWVSNNPNVIAEDGTVTRPELDDAQVTIRAVVGGKTLEEITVTVPATKPAELVDGQLDAIFTKGEPTADSLSWGSAPVELFAHGEGRVSALIYNQKVYIRVEAEGEVSVTLGGEPKTATSEDTVVLVFDNTTVTKYGQKIALNISLDDAAVWNAEGALTVAQTVAGGTPTVLPASSAATKGGNVTIDAANNSFEMISKVGAIMHDNSNCAYWICKNEHNFASTYDTTMDNLLEQTIRIDKMPIGEQTGHFNNGSVNQAWGYTIMFETPSVVTPGSYDFFTAVVFPDAEGNLFLRALNSKKEETEAIALGKTLGEDFKLGMLCGKDGTLSIYVDGTLVKTWSSMRVTAAAVYQSSVMLKYMDPVTKIEGNEEASMTIKDVSVYKLGSKELISLEEEVSKEVIFGNLDLTKVEADIALPTTFKSAYLGEHTLSWTSSNDAVVESDGTVHLNPDASGSAKLSVYLDGSDAALWSADVTVPAKTVVLNALVAGETVEVNGNLNEMVWLDWLKFGTRLPGNMAAAWSRGYAYFAVFGKDAETLTMTVNGKAITVDLVNAEISGITGATVARNAKTGTVEIGIPLTAINVNLTDYNQAVTFSAQLHKGTTSSELQATKLNFSGNVAELKSMGGYTKDNGPWTVLANTLGYDGTAPGKVNYVYLVDDKGAAIDHTQLYIHSAEFLFDKLPVTTGSTILGGAQADGFYYYFSDEDPDTRKGTTICAAIFTENGTDLKLRIGKGTASEGQAFDLGKTLGEKFRITYYWYPNNSMDIYVDGVLLATVANAGYTTDHLGIDVTSYRYYSAKANRSVDVKFSVSNQTTITKKYDKVQDELTKNVVFGRVDLDHVQKDLPMVTSFASANFAELKLEWTTSDASVVTTAGEITRHATEAKSATVTVYFVAENGTKTKLWDVKVTVDPLSVTKQPAPSIIHTAFAQPGSIKIDGAVEASESWLLNGWVLNEKQQAAGFFGTQWDQENLYILLDTEAKNVSLTLGGKEIAVTKTGNITELAIPVSELLNCAKIEEYGVGMTIRVTMDGSTYDGVLKLTNVDWWATDNIYAGLPMLGSNVKSVAMGTPDQPDGNQGAKQLENGWHLYDLYNANGSNPAGIRTYVLFMKMPVYEGFADRTESTQIEFDFYAKALPEWKWDEAIENEVGRAFANYGVTFSLSDKADAAKNSNVAVFGIVNTADEGLVLVVNRGIEDFEHFVLNKQVGEEFRIGMTWLTNANLVLTIDGEEITTIRDMSKFVNSVGDTSFVVNMIRNKDKPTGPADNMDVYLTNIAFGKAHSTENVIRNLTFADFCGKNDKADKIQSDLKLPNYMTNGQLDDQYPITWTSSDDATIDPVTGKVERPESGIKVVTLTATLVNGEVTETKEFKLIVFGKNVNNGNALVVTDDVNPFGMAAEPFTGVAFELDMTNNSIVYAFPENETQEINLVTLTDLDEVSRLNRESLRLFVSDDNKVYTEIKDYKLLHDGCNWYLYDFKANSRYIKVHYTHRDQEDADFMNAPGDMIAVSWNESLAVPQDAVQLAAPSTSLRDQAVAIDLPKGVTTEGLRVALNGKLLFHYVDKDGTVYVRIPDPTDAMLMLWNAEDIELASKENVYEVTYGTRETLPTGGRWILGMKAGQTFPDGSELKVDTLYTMGSKTVSKSTDGGYTWTSVGTVNFATGLSSGGWGIDSKTGRLFHEFYDSDPTFVNADVASSKCATYVFYSDDGGKTWTQAQGLGQIEGDLQSNYVLSYTDLTELAGNDGKGENVDFVFPMGAQYNNNGAFCSRIAYTKDGGLTWQYSASKITYGNETAFEGGVSEATILEREDGTLVFYARCQSGGVDNFTISYSLDHGVTWMTPGATSTVYTTNTQALVMTYDFGGFDGNRLSGAPIFMWGGNNVLGGNSYMRMPLNFAVSTNGMDTFRNIQNIFSETFMDVYDFSADHYITNPSIQQINGHDMYVSFSRLRNNDSIYMVVNDFTDWFTRTKGAYDSFESGNAKYEGWTAAKGSAVATKDKASVGSYSLVASENTQLTRSIPYLQNGKLSIDLYVDASSDFVFELQPAFAVVEQKCAVISAKVKGTTMKLHDGTVLTLNNGWNTLSFDLELTENKASVSVNGGTKNAVKVNTEFKLNPEYNGGITSKDLGNYITYVTILAASDVYVDEFFVESSRDAVTAATEADEQAANAVINQIKALQANNNRTDLDIAAVKNAYAALTQVQKDFVNRRVPTGETTNANAANAFINYYNVLMNLKPAEANDITDIYQASLTLQGNIGVNFYTKVSQTVQEQGAEMHITLPSGVTETTKLANADKHNGDFIFSCEVPAKNMADAIHVKFVADDGTVLEELTYSAMQYVQAVLASNESDEVKKVATALANYGAYAQIHFEHNYSNLANQGVSAEWAEAYAADFQTVQPSTLNGFTVSVDATKAVRLYSVSLLLKAETTMRLFFKIADGVNPETVTFNGQKYTGKRGDLYYFDVTNISAKNLGDAVEITINDGTETYAVSCSPMAYCNIVLNSSMADDLKDVAKALYLYYQAAAAALRR